MGKYTAAVHDHLVLPALVKNSPGRAHALRLMGQPVAAAVPVRLIIDTGSRRSTLLPSVIAHLNPAIQGTARVETSLAFGAANLYWVRLEFPDTGLAPISELAIARLALPPSLSAFHGLIGRDLLSRWDYFVYAGRRGRLSIRDTPGGLFSWLICLEII